MFDWNDIRHFLAVARAGSTLGGGRALGVNQTTSARRVAALEEALGEILFDKGRDGYALTEAGKALVPLAERAEASMIALGDHVAANARQIAGLLKITTNESDADTVVLPAIAAFRMRHPEVRVELVVDAAKLDLVRGEADIALRAASRPTEPGLVVRRLPDELWTVFCSRAYADAHGYPTCMEELRNHAVFAYGPPIALGEPAIWAAQFYDPQRIISTMNNVSNMVAAIRSRAGIGIIPISLGDPQPDFIRCFAPPKEFDSERWLVTTEALRNVPRVRAFMDFVIDHAAQRHKAGKERGANPT